MRTIFVFFLVLFQLCTTAEQAFSQNWQWGHSFGSSNSDFGNDMVTDNMGNVYVLGNVFGTFNIGSGSYTTHGSVDAIVAKYNSSGVLIWHVLIGGTGQESGNAIALDSSGNIYATGNFKNTMICGPDTLIAQGDDIFIVKIDNAGQIQWGRSAGASGTGLDGGFDIAFSGSDNSVVVTGKLTGTALFGTYSVSNSGSFICKLSDAGNWLWAIATNTALSGFGGSVCVDASGAIYETGFFTPGRAIKKFTQAGVWVWDLNAPTGLNFENITSTTYGTIIVCGSYTQYTTFGTVVLNTPAGNGAYWVEFDLNGNAIKGRDLAANGTIYANSLAVNSAGEIFLAGSFDVSLYTDTTFLFDVYQGGYEGFVAKYGSNGSLVWIKQMGTTQSDIMYGLSYWNGKVYVTGYISGTPNPSLGNMSLPSYGQPDGFVAQFSDCSPGYTSVQPGFYVSLCENDSFHLQSTNTSSVFTYQWQLNGVSLAGQTSPYYNAVGIPANSGAYAVQISNGGCTYTSHYVSVTVYPNPTGTMSTLNYGSACHNDSVLLVAPNLPSHTFQWYLNGNIIPGATSRIITAHSTGVYDVVIVSPLGCSATLSVGLITIGNYPIVSALGDDSICGTSPVLLTAGGANSYAWSPSTWLSNTNQASTTSTPQQTITYMVVGTSQNCSDTDYVSIVVNPVPNPSIILNAPALICSGIYASYQWYLNSILIPGATGQIYLPSVNGTYQVSVIDSAGCSATSTGIYLSAAGVEDATMSQIQFSAVYNTVSNSIDVLFDKPIEKGQIEIYNTTGQNLFSLDIQNQDRVQINAEQFATGIYYIRFADQENFSAKTIALVK